MSLSLQGQKVLFVAPEQWISWMADLDKQYIHTIFGGQNAKPHSDVSLVISAFVVAAQKNVQHICSTACSGF